MGFILDSATPLLGTQPVDIKRPERGEGIDGRALAARSWESKMKLAFGLRQCSSTQFVNSGCAARKTKLETALLGSAQEPHGHHLGVFKHPDLQTTPQSCQVRVPGARVAVFRKPRPAGDSRCSQSRSYCLIGRCRSVSTASAEEKQPPVFRVIKLCAERSSERLILVMWTCY